MFWVISPNSKEEERQLTPINFKEANNHGSSVIKIMNLVFLSQMLLVDSENNYGTRNRAHESQKFIDTNIAAGKFPLTKYYCKTGPESLSSTYTILLCSQGLDPIKFNSEITRSRYSTRDSTLSIDR